MTIRPMTLPSRHNIAITSGEQTLKGENSMEEQESNESEKSSEPDTNVDKKISQEALSNLLTTLAESFQKERQKSEPYKEMFKAGSTYTGLLRQLELPGESAALDACDVVERRFKKKGNNNLYEFLLAVPYLAYKLRKQIEKEEGSACCVDKAFFILSEHMKTITG